MMMSCPLFMIVSIIAFAEMRWHVLANKPIGRLEFVFNEF